MSCRDWFLEEVGIGTRGVGVAWCGFVGGLVSLLLCFRG